MRHLIYIIILSIIIILVIWQYKKIRLLIYGEVYLKLRPSVLHTSGLAPFIISHFAIYIYFLSWMRLHPPFSPESVSSLIVFFLSFKFLKQFSTLKYKKFIFQPFIQLLFHVLLSNIHLFKPFWDFSRIASLNLIPCKRTALC